MNSEKQRALEEENRKIRHLRLVIDLTTAQLYSGTLSLPEMIALVSRTRAFVLSLFPDKEETYNLIYKPRFDRIINETISRN